MYINHQGYLVLYLRLIRNMDVRIHLIQMRENPPTISANSVCPGKPVAHFSRTREHPRESQRWMYREACRGNVDYRIPGIPHSTVQKEDRNRKDTVDRLTQHFGESPELGLR